jgi:hypothetical protein
MGVSQVDLMEKAMLSSDLKEEKEFSLPGERTW